MQSNQIRILSSLGLLLTAVIWGFAFVVVKNSLDLIPPIYMLAFRFTIAAAALTLIMLPRLRHISRRDWTSGVILGAFLFTAYAVQTIGCQYTTAGKNAFLTTIYVMIVPFLHWLINRKRPDGYAVAAALIAIAGIGLLSLQGGDAGVNIGDVLTIVCGFFYAIHIVYIDRYTETQDPVILTVLQMFFAAVFSWIFAPLYDGGFPAAAFHSEVVTGMLYLGLFSTMLGFLLQNVGQKYTAPSTASLLLSFESVFGVLFSVIFLREQLTARMLLGCLLMLIAVLLVETRFAFVTQPLRRLFIKSSCPPASGGSSVPLSTSQSPQSSQIPQSKGEHS